MQNLIVLFFSILISSSLFSQNIKGTVSDKNGTPISELTIGGERKREVEKCDSKNKRS